MIISAIGQPACISDSKTVLSGQRIEAVSAMKCTPQNTITWASVLAAFWLNSKESPTKKTIYLFHSPPYKTYLDLADLKDLKVDYAPFDIHIGSIAIERFIKKYKPFLTLHGHAHESVRLSGKWIQKILKTYFFSTAHYFPYLSLIKFDTNLFNNSTQSLIKTI